jgi:hypothetical protein
MQTLTLEYYTCSKCNSHKVSESASNGMESTHTCGDCNTVTKNGKATKQVPHPTYEFNITPWVDKEEVVGDKEFERFFNAETGFPFGVNLIVDFHAGAGSYDTTYCYNVTEIHNLYDSDSKYCNTAFESDIHKTGWTPTQWQMSRITVVKAEEIHERF